MNKTRRQRPIIRTCTYTRCIRKDFCPNHTPYIKRDSIAFSSCMYYKEESKDELK